MSYECRGIAKPFTLAANPDKTVKIIQNGIEKNGKSI